MYMQVDQQDRLNVLCNSLVKKGLLTHPDCEVEMTRDDERRRNETLDQLFETLILPDDDSEKQG
jgi:hypothetical protein